MMTLIPYDTLETADTRSAELWAHARREGWQPNNVTTHLYARRVRTGDPEIDADLPAEGDAFIAVGERDERLDGLILEALLTADELLALVSVYPVWESGGTYAVNDLRSYGGRLYRCVQAHANYDPSHTPDITDALWADTVPEGVIPEWVQPQGAHDAYNKGDRVTYEGWIWESTIDANVWAPGVYGWVQIEPL